MTQSPLQAAVERVGAVLNERTRKYVIAAGDGYIWQTLEIADLRALLDTAREIERLRARGVRRYCSCGKHNL